MESCIIIFLVGSKVNIVVLSLFLILLLFTVHIVAGTAVVLAAIIELLLLVVHLVRLLLFNALFRRAFIVVDLLVVIHIIKKLIIYIFSVFI